MILRRASAICFAIFAVAACKHEEPRTQSGKPAPTPTAAPSAAADPWSAPKPAAKNPLQHPLFWAVEKDGKTTYFLGTMHVGVDPVSRIPDLVWHKLEAAPTFAMEADLSAGPPDVVRHDGGTLHADLGDDYWKKLETALGADSAKRLDRLKPMIAATMLETRSFPETVPMDAALSGHALNAHKKMVYLEPVEKQIAVLEKWTNTRVLKEQLDDLDITEQHAKEMLAAYVDGDAAKIEQLADQERVLFKKHGHSDAEYDAEMEDLLYRRNASWIPELEELHGSGGGFVAVGAMHLIGKRSVLYLLAQRGYKVTRVTAETPVQ